MMKLTRLDRRTVGINPDHVAWVESTPDTTLHLLDGRTVLVRESMDEVVERFVEAHARMGRARFALHEPAAAAAHHHDVPRGGEDL